MSEDTKIDDGGPAFPRTPFDVNDYAGDGSQGMSLRDWFAGQALAGMIVCNKWDDISALENAEDAYSFADAMIKVRKVKR